MLAKGTEFASPVLLAAVVCTDIILEKAAELISIENVPFVVVVDPAHNLLLFSMPDEL
jgi:hypothetical protein